MPFLRSLAVPTLLLAGCVTNIDTSETVAANKPGAYMVVIGKDYAPADLAPYAASLPPIYAKYGGEYVALTTDMQVMEGRDDMQAVIISAWPDAASARAFWTSPEYAEAIKLRDGIGTFDVVIVPALPYK